MTADTGAVEAQHAFVKDHHGALENHCGVVEAGPGVIEAHLGRLYGIPLIKRNLAKILGKLLRFKEMFPRKI